MPFFQNKNTGSTSFAPPFSPTSGIDNFDLETDSTWNKLLGVGFINHARRKQALQELIYIVYFMNQKPFINIGGSGVEVKCPHHELYDKFFKFLIKKNPTSGVPRNDLGDDLFDDNISRNSQLILPDISFPISLARTNLYLPGLESEIIITDNIKNALIASQTTVGYIAEACTVFSYFYLVREFSKLNDYIFNHTRQFRLVGVINNPPDYFSTIGTNLAIQIKTSVPENNLPFAYLSLREKMKDNNFRSTQPAYYVELAKLFKPLTYLGSSYDDSTPSISADGDMFLQNLYNLMNVGNTSVGIKLYSDTILTAIPDKVGKQNHIKGEIKTIYSDIITTIEEIISKESKFLYKAVVKQSELIPESIILASGIGTTTSGLLGIQKLGVSLFSYQLGDNSLPQKTNTSKKIQLYRNTNPVIHIVPIGLDHKITYEYSKLTIINSSIGNENYPFIFNSLYPITALPPNGYGNHYIGTSVGTDFEYRLQKTGGSTITLASFQNSDLKFSGFSNTIYSDFGIINSLNIEVKLESEITAGPLVEELQVIINYIKPEEITAVLSDNIFFENDKFELKDRNIDLLFGAQTTFLQRLRDLLLSGQATFVSPILNGSFVGKERSIISANQSRVEVDSTYIPVTAHAPMETTTNDELQFKKIRYSFTKISLIQIGINTFEIHITIESFVSPLISRLDNDLLLAYNSLTTQLNDLNTRFTISGYTVNSVSGSIKSYNQALAMLRSFGVLEAICYSLLNACGGNPAVKIVLSNLLSNSTTESKDNTFNNNNPSYLIPNNIKYNDYKSFKWYLDATNAGYYLYKTNPF